jgi:hypothetical protein
VTWNGLDVDLAKLKQRAGLTVAMTERYPDTKLKADAAPACLCLKITVVFPLRCDRRKKARHQGGPNYC